jgi:hypothetical protein
VNSNSLFNKDRLNITFGQPNITPGTWEDPEFYLPIDLDFLNDTPRREKSKSENPYFNNKSNDSLGLTLPNK